MTRLRALVGERRNTSPANAASWLIAILVLAVAIPANEKIGKNAVFFAAHTFSPIAWVLLLLAALALVWLVLFGILALVKKLTSRRSHQAIYDIVASVITFALAWFFAGNAITLNLMPDVPVGGFAIGLLIALAVTWLARRFAMGNVLLGVSAIAMAVPLISVVTQEQAAQTDAFTFAADAPKPNVVWVISDETSYPLLFDQQGKVRDQFPNLQELQQDSTTYTRVYTSSNFTDYAVPSQLSGVNDLKAMTTEDLQNMRAGIGVIPGFGKDYTVVTESPMFHYDCNDEKCAAASADQEAGFAENAWIFAKDAWAVAGNTVLAHPFVDNFPSLDGKWRDYWAGGDEFAADTSRDTVSSFIDGITAATTENPESPFFGFWHTIRTHGPWVLDAEGNQMFPARVPIVKGAHMAGADKNETVATDELVDFEQRLYVYAAQDMDRQVGELIASLKQLGVYDDTMIVFTADHGVAVTRNKIRRVGDSVTQRWSEIVHVPLMIKAPGQTEPAVVDDIRTTGQIARTVLDTTGAQVPADLPLEPSLANDPSQSPKFAMAYVNGLVGEDFPNVTEVDPWTPDDLTPPDPKHPFAIGIDPALLEQPLPAGATQQPAAITTFPGDSPQQLIKAEREAPACGPSKVGLVTSTKADTVIGSILWQGEQGQRGWAIVPKSTDGYRLWCTPAA